MSTDSDDRDREDEFADLIAQLGQIGRRIDRERFPGEAWPAGRRRGRRVVFRLVVATAAAAVLLLAAALAWWHFGRPAEKPPEVARQPTTSPAETRPVDWSIPTGVDPSVASQVTWRMPRVSMPSMVDPNSRGWSIPSISFPSFRTERTGGKTRATSQPQAT